MLDFDRIIGEIFDFNGRKLRVAKSKEENPCSGCIFNIKKECNKEETRDIIGCCSLKTRSDKTNIIFVDENNINKIDIDICFRAKNINSGNWMEGYLREVWGKHNRCFTISPARTFESDGFTDIEEDYVKPETICQFTGLYDINGKKIYQSDIVCFENKGNKFYCIVDWNREVGSWCIAFGDTHVGVKPLGEWLCEHKFEVVGNRFDNSDLLIKMF